MMNGDGAQVLVVSALRAISNEQIQELNDLGIAATEVGINVLFFLRPFPRARLALTLLSPIFTLNAQKIMPVLQASKSPSSQSFHTPAQWKKPA